MFLDIKVVFSSILTRSLNVKATLYPMLFNILMAIKFQSLQVSLALQETWYAMWKFSPVFHVVKSCPHPTIE